MSRIKTEVAIIGAGPVGIFASFQAGMLGMTAAVVDILDFPGGQCSALYPQKPIYDIPAYSKISGADLIKNLLAQADFFKPSYFLEQMVESVTPTSSGFLLRTSKNIEIESKIILIAAGAGAFGPKRPELQHLEYYEGKAVHYFIQEPELFRNKKIAIAGGGDSAIDWAISLAEIVNKIYLIHRREKFRCLPGNMEIINNLVKLGKIEMIIPYQLHSLTGNIEKGILSHITVSDLETNCKNLDAQYLLAFFGLASELGPIKTWGLEYKHSNILVNQETCETNIPGIYAIGDVAHYPGKLKLILTGFAEAATSLHHSYQRVFGKQLHFEHSTSKKF